jgi:hypothetical protein
VACNKGETYLGKSLLIIIKEINGTKNSSLKYNLIVLNIFLIILKILLSLKLVEIGFMLKIKKTYFSSSFVTDVRYHVSAVKLYVYYQRNADIIVIVIIVRNFTT